ncbi:MAG: HDOD domain-containing protein [Chlorobiota bacterium]|nr:MAG: HDOD domain-containing protein [Chlorobiota bacterium]
MPIFFTHQNTPEKCNYQIFFAMNFLDSLQQTNEIASLPTVAAKLLQMLEQDDSDVRRLAHYVEQDVAISTKVVRVANSPMFGLRIPVASISQAIMTIGLTRVTNIVLGVSIFSKFVYLRTLAGAFLEQFWRHSAATATLARALASRAKLNFQEMEFLAGLVHDIGKLAMLQSDPERFRILLETIGSGTMDELEAEQQIYGATHAEAGELIANVWRLPSYVQGAIRLHHEGSCSVEDVAPLVAVVRIADYYAEEFGYGIGERHHTPIESHSYWHLLAQRAPETFADPAALCDYLEGELGTASALITALTSE